MTSAQIKVIPATPLYHRYRFFEHTTKGERRAMHMGEPVPTCVLDAAGWRRHTVPLRSGMWVGPDVSDGDHDV